MYKNIIFWLEYPLFHVVPLIASMANSNSKVIVVCEKNIPQWRLDMGFHYPDFGNAKVINEPSKLVRNEIIAKYSGSNSVHIFHGLRSTKKNFKCFKILVNKNCSVGLYFEYLLSDKIIKFFLRNIYYRFLFGRYNKKIDFMLALGDLGKNKYIALGLPFEKVFTFNYFVENNYIVPLQSISEVKSATIKVLFVGRLIEVKNVQILISSFREVTNIYDNITLTIVGEGALKSSLYKYVEISGLKNKVQFLDYSSSHELKEIYSKHDVFVLPSKWEGWGAVVVEAMAHGLPVVVSNTCASSSIIKKQVHGVVFDSKSENALTEALYTIIEGREKYFSIDSKAERLTYATDNLSAEAGKNELLKILGSIYIINN